MPIKKEIIRGGIRLTHPSGHVVITSVKNLNQHRESTMQMISFLQDQIKFIDKNIQEIKEAEK